jgi:uncharacterized OB-fold protein
MECYSCGQNILAHAQVCPACGSPRSKRVYISLWGILGGLIGSFVGYSIAGMPSAIILGLVGIAGFELVAWLCLGRETDGAA